MPKINFNGVTRDMTVEEIAEMDRIMAQMPAPQPTAEELIAQQAQEIAYLKEALDALLSGVTDDEAE